jgi:hypothetical protein
MAIQVGVPLAAMCLVALVGCAAVAPNDPLPNTAERNRGNATVRAAVYVEAASNVATPAPTATAELASKSAAARGKQDKRAAQPPNRKDNKRAAPPAVPAKQVAAASDPAGRPIDQRVPVSATGYRYTYAVELDAGGTRTYGFATDQGLLVGDRVLVSDTGVTVIPK